MNVFISSIIYRVFFVRFYTFPSVSRVLITTLTSMMEYLLENFNVLLVISVVISYSGCDVPGFDYGK
jgi:Fe2+ transport system protein B